jgi:hypothetical protein
MYRYMYWQTKLISERCLRVHIVTNLIEYLRKFESEFKTNIGYRKNLGYISGRFVEKKIEDEISCLGTYKIPM